MKDPFAEYQKERDSRIIQSIFDAIGLIGEGYPVEKVAEQTGLELKDIHKVKKVVDFFRKGAGQ